MGATSSAARARIRGQAFSLAKSIRSSNNFFGRKRKNYLTAVIGSDLATMRATESRLFEKLRAEGNKEISAVLVDRVSRKGVVELLRMGVPLPNALKIALLRRERRTMEHTHLPHAPRYRKPKVLELEREIVQFEYQSLRIARKKAEELGLARIEGQLRRQIEARARVIAEYNKIIEKRLVE